MKKQIFIPYCIFCGTVLIIAALGLLSIAIAYSEDKPNVSYLLLTVTTVTIVCISFVGSAIIKSMSYHWTRIIDIEEKEITSNRELTVAKILDYYANQSKSERSDGDVVISKADYKMMENLINTNKLPSADK